MKALKFTTVDLEKELTLPKEDRCLWIDPKVRGSRKKCYFGYAIYGYPKMVEPDWSLGNSQQHIFDQPIKNGDRWAYVEFPKAPPVVKKK